MNRIILVSQTSEAIWIPCDINSNGFDTFHGCDLFCMLCLPIANSLCTIRCLHSESENGYPYKIPDRWTLNSPDLNPIDYKILGIIQQRVQSTKVQDVKDLMQRLIGAWSGVEESSVIQFKMSLP